jgi:hypothetical protein
VAVLIESKVLGFDTEAGVVETFHYDHASDEIIIENTQDVDSITELNRALANDERTDWRGRKVHRVASIPVALLPELEKKGIMTAAGVILDKKALRRWLNDRDNLAFRTKLGRI